jgi:hypothetical protein
MAHWAEIDENNIVLRVTVGNNDEPDEGYQWLIDNLGGTWIQTSYNGNIRRRFAGIGFTYDSVNDVFIAPQPFPSWSVDENFDWQPPVPRPDDYQNPDGSWTLFEWDEKAGAWVEV